MNTVIKANHGFTVSEENGKSLFVYTQEKFKTRTIFTLIFASALLSVLLLGIIRPSSGGTGFAWWLFLTIGIFQLVKYLLNKNRTTKSFSIDKQGFNANGNTYLREHITGLYIQAWRSPQTTSINMQSTGMFIPVSSNASSMLAASTLNAVNAVGKIGDAMGNVAHNRVIAISYRIFLRYGNRNIILANGITADTADLMLQKIIEVSDSYKKQ
jgi:hypothetical protein